MITPTHTHGERQEAKERKKGDGPNFRRIVVSNEKPETKKTRTLTQSYHTTTSIPRIIGITNKKTEDKERLFTQTKEKTSPIHQLELINHENWLPMLLEINSNEKQVKL